MRWPSETDVQALTMASSSSHGPTYPELTNRAKYIKHAEFRSKHQPSDQACPLWSLHATAYPSTYVCHQARPYEHRRNL